MTPKEKQEFIAEVAAAVACSIQHPVLSNDEHQWVKLAIQREAQSIELRQAIISHTLKGLIWAGVVGLFYVLKEWAQAHGFKP